MVLSIDQMSISTLRSTEVTIPDDLRSPRAKLVYLYLSVVGSATREEIASTLDIGTGTTLSITNTLRNRGYLEYRNNQYVIN